MVGVGVEQRATEVGRDGGGRSKQNDLGKVKHWTLAKFSGTVTIDGDVWHCFFFLLIC